MPESDARGFGGRCLPESDARSLEEGAGKRCSKFGRMCPNLAEFFRERCRKAILEVLEVPAGKRYSRFWKVPESDARSLEEGAGKRCSEFRGRCRKAILEDLEEGGGK